MANVTSHCCADWVGPGCRLKHVETEVAASLRTLSGALRSYAKEKSSAPQFTGWVGDGMMSHDELGELQNVCFSTYSHQFLMAVLTKRHDLARFRLRWSLQ